MSTESAASKRSFTDLFIRRPVIAIVVNLVIIIAGVQAIRTLNVRQYPRSENAVISVTTVYVGASADLVRGFITTPLERVIASADGIDYLESTSTLGLSTINARLRLNYDSTKALAEISSKVDQVRNDLPPEAQVPVLNITSADSQFASAYLSFSSEFLKQNEITDYLTRVVQPRLTAVEGVQKADLLGARTFAMRVWLRPEKMAALNISPAQVRTALANNNYLSAVGQTKGSLVQVNLTANTDLRSVDEFKQLIIRQTGGAVVRLSDIADVVLGAEDYDTSVGFTGQTAVFVGIWALPNANSLDVIKKSRVELESIRKELPEQINFTVAYDGTAYIQSAIDDVVRTLRDTLLIVVIVIFLFLGSFRSVLVPVLAIPVSLIGAVFLMQVFGFTVNLLTLLAIVLSVGLVVDDAIVVVENVERHLEEGLTPFQASLQGARELVGPIVAMTITLAAVYAPIAFQGGLTGSLFREFALTLAGAVTISGFVALTLSPMMSRYLLKQGGTKKGFAAFVNRQFARLRNAYSRGLDVALHSRGMVYAAWGLFIVLLCAMYVFGTVRELAPAEDQGVIFGIVNTPANSTLDQLTVSTKEVNRTMMELPEAQFTFQITNPGGGFWGVGLKPWNQRKKTTGQELPEVQRRISMIPGIQTFAVLPPALPGGGTFPVEVVIASTAEESEILDFAKQLQGKAMASGIFYFPPQIDVKIDQPQSEIDIDREKVAQLGLNLQQVGQDLGAAVGGNFVNRFSIQGRSYKVIPQLLRTDRLNPDQLKDVYVNGPDGKLIKLSSIATVKDEVVPRSLNRFNQLNAVKLSGVAQSVDGGLKVLEAEAAKLLPKGYKVDYTGESRQLRVEGSKFGPAMGLALVLIFLVLAAQFNSFRDPLVILMGSVPLAFFGAMLPVFLKMPNPQIHFFTDPVSTTFNIYSQVGLVTLVGLISKNGILIVEFANKLQEAGKTKLEAVKEASLTRLRPILMTSFATVSGHMPLTWVSGPGAAARNSIGRVLVTGMAVGTIFTLFFVPVIYMLIARDHRAEEAEGEAPEPSAGGGRLSPAPAAPEP
jgi:multidrug efflux pump